MVEIREADLTAELQFDVLVVGSGAGALLTAIRAVDEGLTALVVEKTALVGGTSAVSGGAIWIPDNHDMASHGLSDSVDAAFNYIKTCAQGLSSNKRALAYAETAPDMARYLDKIGLPYCAMPHYADYYPHIENSMSGGRTMDPAIFDAAKLGVTDLAKMRETNPGQKILGRVLINAFEARKLITRQAGAKGLAIRILLGYWLDLPWRFKTSRDRRLTGGQALVAGLFTAIRQRDVPLWLESPMQSLLHEDGKVTGIIVMREGKPVAVRARKGVMLAAGGFERNQAMREKYLPLPSEQAWTATPLECNTGQAIEAGAKVGGALHMMTHTWGVPTLKVENEEKFRGVFVERSMPGCLVVNENGVRFVNESCPYPEFQQAMFANHAKTGGTIHVWIVFDAEFRQKYPMGPLLPGESFPDKKLPTSWLGKQYWRDETIGGLARQTGINEQGLIASVKKFNEFARTGKDLDFGRGGNDYDRYYGDDSVQPNPNLARLSKGPYYAMQLFPGDIGTKGGLLTDMDGQVLDDMGQVISGLFCTGNNAASVMGPSYPGAGATLGASMTFAYRAVARMAGKPIALKRKDLLGT